MENIEGRRHSGPSGEKNFQWKGGIADYKDHYQMKLNRLEKLKQTNAKCEVCKIDANQIHHIDFSNDNHNISNLVVLCSKHHKLLHKLNRINNPYTSKWKRKYGMTLSEMSDKIGYSDGHICSVLTDRLKPNKGGITKEQMLVALGIV